jgi:isoleucyl-tRNA synthetase
MSIYKEYKQLNQPEIEKEILQFWKEHKIFERSVSEREGAEPFVFYEGPPSANGMPGIHHVMARAIKDIFCRYQTLKGKQVKRKAGWDTHGLPIELAVEKTLGIRKDDIGKTISIEDYNKACRSEVMKYTDKWEELTEVMGYWVDMKHPYITYENKYIESVWYLLKMLYDKGLLYKGYSIQPYSPAAGTGLSSHELNQPGTYKDVKDMTAVAMFKIISPSPALPKGKGVDSEEKVSDKMEAMKMEKVLPLGEDLGGAYFLAWTTTPWTLPSNTALAIGKNIEYAIVETFNHYSSEKIKVVLAKDLMGKYFPEKNAELKFEDYKAGDKSIPFKILSQFKGLQLEGLRYEQLLPFEANKKENIDGDAFKVVVGDFVTTEDGTGIVHIAPSFGSDDFRVAKANGIGALTLVDKRGKFVEGVGEFSNEFVKEQYLNDEERKSEIERLKNLPETSEFNSLIKKIVTKENKYLSVDERIVLKLEKEGKLFKKEKYDHSYPHCWRTDKPVLYYPLDSWFIKTTALKDRMVELNKTIQWKPESTGTGRFGNWLENLQDWNLSRSRFWGIPLPIWRTDDGSEEKCIGSVQLLHDEIEKAVALGFMKSNPMKDFKKGDLSEANYNTFDLHRPYADDIILVSNNNKPMKRESDLIDVWFDSGAMPYAQLHYPFENKNQIEQRTSFPADFIAEGVDQTRGWFFTLHAIATMCFDSVAYKTVVSNGLVLDKNGNKMSKRLGNAVDPFTTIAKHGADATRWYMIANAAPWDNLKFDIEGINEVKRKLFGTLYNTYGFFALYANVDQFQMDEQNIVPVEKRIELDRWIISKLQSLIEEVSSCFDSYEPHRAARAIEIFVDEHLSNWYVRLSRRRFWKSEMNEDKKAAYETLFECLMVTSQLMSPIAPFFSDWMYQNLTSSIREKDIQNKTPLQFASVHLTHITKVERKYQDKELEERMYLAQRISSLALSLRKKANIKVRQPLNRILIPVLNEDFKNHVEKIKDLILSEINVKQIEYVNEDAGIIKKKAKANFKLLGARLGKKMKAVADLVNVMDGKAISQLELYETILFTVEDEELAVNLNEVEILSEELEGWSVASENGITVALDIHISEELIEEGHARELVNRIQKIRKERDFSVTDRIEIILEKQDFILATLKNYKTYICAEILADKIELQEQMINADVIDVNDYNLKIIVEKI